MEKLKTAYEKELAARFSANDPTYEYVKTKFSAKELSEKMIKDGAQCVNIGPALKDACKSIGIKPTYKAIDMYLKMGASA